MRRHRPGTAGALGVDEEGEADWPGPEASGELETLETFGQGAEDVAAGADAADGAGT